MAAQAPNPAAPTLAQAPPGQAARAPSLDAQAPNPTAPTLAQAPLSQSAQAPSRNAQAPNPAAPTLLQGTQDPLAELRDIHLPGPVADWPPAPGWWLLALILCLALGGALTALWRRWQARRYRRDALAELRALHDDWQASGDAQRYLTRLQSLLKRTALTGFPRAQVASLTGEAWVTFLDNSAAMHGFAMDEAAALIDGAYQRQPQVPVAALQRLAETWVQRHHPKHLAERQAGGGHA